MKGFFYIAGTVAVLFGIAYGLGLSGVLSEPPIQGIIGGLLPSVATGLGVSFWFVASSHEDDPDGGPGGPRDPG